MFQKNVNLFDNITLKNLICRVNICAPDWGETDCIYDYNKFYYFLGGEGTLIIEEDEYQPEPGELYLIPADTRHTYFHNPKSPVFKYWCHFDMSFGEGKKLVYSKDVVKCKIPEDTIKPIFEKLIEANMSRTPLDTLSEKSALLELIRIFMSNTDYIKLLPTADNFINRINEYINQNICSNITLKQMADLFHLHPNYFTQYFKKYFNVSPIEHVNIIRLERGARLLRSEPQKSIGEAAIEVGFNDYRYFSRLFKKRYGITPSAYKEIHLL